MTAKNSRRWIAAVLLVPPACGLAMDALIAYGTMGWMPPTIAVCGFISGVMFGLLTVFALWLSSTSGDA
jgi:hypothetical protein